MEADPTPQQSAQVLTILRRSPLISALLQNWDKIALPDAWLVAGALAQTVWNDAFNRPSDYGIADIDIVYFDASDLSDEMEERQSRRLRARFADLSAQLDVKNEARVHLWYEAKFGFPIAPYISTQNAISTFPTTATCMGVRPENGALRLYAPYGVSDLLNLTVRANKKLITRPVYEAKVERWLKLWPELRVVGWDD